MWELISWHCMLLCRGARAAIIVYDITSADSFKRAKSWVAELQGQGQPMIMALAGARCHHSSLTVWYTCVLYLYQCINIVSPVYNRGAVPRLH